MSAPLYVFMGIAIIILASGISKAIRIRAERGGAPNDALTGLEGRMAAVERRLGDIQEIVLSTDEKLERLESQLLTRTHAE